MTNPRNVVGTGKSHAFRPSQQKIMKNIKLTESPGKIKQREKGTALNQMVMST